MHFLCPTISSSFTALKQAICKKVKQYQKAENKETKIFYVAFVESDYKLDILHGTIFARNLRLLQKYTSGEL